jgi:hypothetical protein
VPAITDPNIGFRLNLDYRNLEPGVHTLEVLIRANEQLSIQLAKRSILIVDRRLSTPPRIAYVDTNAQPLSTDPSLSGCLDGPSDFQSACYNPLSQLWLEYRNQVVRNYIELFAEIARESGIPKEKIFSHQYSPRLYGTCNGDLVATDGSQQPSALYNQGATLYGGSAFGTAFIAMKQQFGWDRYGVNEMHPIVKLTSDEYLSLFDMHRKNGAVFVAPFYISMLPSRPKSGGDLDRFRIAPDSQRLGSNLYWQSIIDVMKH